MEPHLFNPLGQPIGLPLAEWTPPPHPGRTTLVGRVCRVDPLDPVRHADALYAANALDVDGRGWTYLPYGPFTALTGYIDWMRATCLGDDPLFYAITDLATDGAVGVASYLRIDIECGAIEVGHIHYSPLLQRTIAATEAMYLLMKHVFDLGYRRYEWKCDALNEPSRRAASRLGFCFEGLFRQARIYKGRNRDTAWYSILDRDWPALDSAFQQWLDPSNFDAEGNQRFRLSELTAPLRGDGASSYAS